MMENRACWEIRPLSNPNISKEEFYRHLVGWAILAPSTHNAQPWRFLLRPVKDSIEMRLDQNYVLPISDPTGRQSFISLGAAYENLKMAANCYGLDCSTAYLSEGINIQLAGNPQLPPLTDDLLLAMKNRMTNRGKFDFSRKIGLKFLRQIKDAAFIFGTDLNLIEDTPTRFAIAELQYLADRYVIARTDFRRELAEYLLPNDSILGRGMPGNTFGLNDDAAKKIHELLKADGLFDPNLAAGFAITNRDAIKSSPLIAVLSAPEDSPIWWIKIGQALERIAILCELEGLSLAINAALIEVWIF
ncbi:MAG: hypothetical protein AAB930_02115, partial [Patescibacteria group bacterium]